MITLNVSPSYKFTNRPQHLVPFKVNNGVFPPYCLNCSFTFYILLLHNKLNIEHNHIILRFYLLYIKYMMSL